MCKLSGGVARTKVVCLFDSTCLKRILTQPHGNSAGRFHPAAYTYRLADASLCDERMRNGVALRPGTLPRCPKIAPLAKVLIYAKYSGSVDNPN